MGRGLEVRRMRGGHATMLKEPEVEELGQQLKICLDKARSCAAGQFANPSRNRAHPEMLPKRYAY